MAAGNINGNSTTGSAVMTPLRQHRPISANAKQQPILSRQSAAATTLYGDREDSRRTAASVKLWLIRGVVQVRMPRTSNGSSTRYRDRVGKSLTVGSLPSAAPARKNNATPENSGLIGTNNGNGAHCRDEKCLGGAGSTVDDYDVNIPPGESPSTYTFTRHVIRSTYMDKSIDAKKKVIRMLFVVVAEFFVCWAPLHVLNTWYTFNPEAVYQTVGSTGVSLVQLLAYISSCCNPITYCFMNRKFRQAFLGVFDCYRCLSMYCCCCCCCPDVGPLRTLRDQHRGDATHGALGPNNNSDVSGNDSTVFAGRASVGARSEVVELEPEDRV